jgi:predicted ester cyclase
MIERMFNEMINEQKVEVLDELFDPAFVSHTAQGDLDREGFRGFVQGWLAAFPDMKNEVSQYLEQGDHVSWTVRATGTHLGEFNGIPATGRKVDFLSMNHGIARDGRGLEHWVVMDLMTLLTQLGVIPNES